MSKETKPELNSIALFHSGFITLLLKELMRFWKVFFQTIAAPVFTALLYLFVFEKILSDRIVYEDISYAAFLIPGLIMMSMLQNSFANPSSSLIQSRITGNLVFMLLSPISHLEIFFAYILAAITRGLIVGLFIWLATITLIPLYPKYPFWIVIFSIISCGIMSVLGLIAGLWSEKFDQLAVFQNFLITPTTFLSGVFYTFHSLSPFWQNILRWNPIFYTIDGLRYGFFSKSDVSPYFGLFAITTTFILVSIFALRLLAIGYKLRN